MDLSYYTKKLSGYYICEKCLWFGNISVDINHINNDLTQPLNYEEAFKKMLKKVDQDKYKLKQ